MPSSLAKRKTGRTLRNGSLDGYSLCLNRVRVLGGAGLAGVVRRLKRCPWTAVFRLSEAGRKASLPDGRNGRRRQQIVFRFPSRVCTSCASMTAAPRGSNSDHDLKRGPINASSALMKRPFTTPRRPSSRCSRRPLRITNSRPRTTPRVLHTDQHGRTLPEAAQPGRGVVPA